MNQHVVISVIAGMGAFLCLHIVIWRLRPSNAPRMLLLGLLAGIGMIVSSLDGVLFGEFSGFDLCAVLWIDAFAVVVYFFVYAGLSRSVSVSLLSRLSQMNDSFLEFNTLVEEYAGSSRFEDRIRLMQDNGLVEISGPSVTLTRSGFRLACWSDLLGRVIGDGLKG